MRGTLAHEPEVAGRAHDALPEMVVPDAVDHNAGREGVVRTGEPAGQRGAAARRAAVKGRRVRGRFRIEQSQEAGLHFLERGGVIGKRKDMGLGCRGP